MLDIYTDGSFRKDKVSCGFVAKNGSNIIHCETEVYNANDGYANVSGELLAVMRAISWAYEHGYREVRVNYDYAGVEHFVKDWTPKTRIAKVYADFIKKMGQKMKIEFNKVVSHGDQNNSLIDSLVRQRVRMVTKRRLTPITSVISSYEKEVLA